MAKNNKKTTAKKKTPAKARAKTAKVEAAAPTADQ
jgi:hypothetical protein